MSNLEKSINNFETELDAFGNQLQDYINNQKLEREKLEAKERAKPPEVVYVPRQDFTNTKALKNATVELGLPEENPLDLIRQGRIKIAKDRYFDVKADG